MIQYANLEDWLDAQAGSAEWFAVAVARAKAEAEVAAMTLEGDDRCPDEFVALLRRVADWHFDAPALEDK